MFWDLCGPRGCHVKLTWGGGHLLCLDQGPVWSSLPPTPECPRSTSDTTPANPPAQGASHTEMTPALFPTPDGPQTEVSSEFQFANRGGGGGEQAGKMMEDWGALGWGQRDFTQQCSLYLWGGWRRGWDFQKQNVLISPARHVEEAGLGTG